jgi:O-antigen/teichoic acid export membrane protein
LARIGAHTLLFNALGLAANLASGIIIARALGTDGRGELTAITTIVVVAVWVFGMGAIPATSFHVARHPEDAGRLLASWLVMLVPIALVAAGALELLAPVFLAAQEAETLDLARLFVLTMLPFLVFQAAYGVLLGDHDFLFANALGFLRFAAISTAYAVLWAVGALEVSTALIALATIEVVFCGIALWRCVHRHGLARPDAALARSTLWYGLRAHGTQVGGVVNGRLDLLIMPAFLGAASVGLYSVATNVSWIVFTIASGLAAVVLPAAVRREEDRTWIVVSAMYATLGVGLVLATALALVAEPAVELVYGASFTDSTEAILLLLPGTVALALAAVLGSGLYSLERPGLAAMAQLPGIAITVVGLLLFLESGGIVAAAIVSSVAYAAVLLTSLVLYRATAGIRWAELAPNFADLRRFARRATSRFRGRRRRPVRHMIPGTKDIRATEVLLTVALALFAALALVYGVELGLALPGGAAAGIVIVLASVLLVHSVSRCRAALRAGGGFNHLGTIILSGGILLAVVVPGMQLLSGSRVSRTEDLGFPIEDVGPDIGLAFLVFSLALIAFYAGEVLAERPSRGEAARSTLRQLGRPSETRTTYGFLMFVGAPILLGTLAGGEAGFENRGFIEGQGAIQLLGYAPPLGVSIGILNRHWGSRNLALLSLLAFGLMVAIGLRTPLLIVAVALGVRYLYSGAARRIGLREALAMGLAVYILAIMVVSLSAWRGQRYEANSMSLGAVMVKAAENPFVHLSQRGQVDSVDGLILSTKVDREYVGATASDPLKIITGFIPHQLWPEKPKWLSAEVSQGYTNFGASGAGFFLSGPGYLIIVFGTAAAVPLVFLLLGFGSESVFRRMAEPSIWTVLIAYFLTRFYFAGDAFDAFHTLGLCLVVLLGRGFNWAVAIIHRPPEAKRRLQTATRAREPTAV